MLDDNAAGLDFEALLPIIVLQIVLSFCVCIHGSLVRLVVHLFVRLSARRLSVRLCVRPLVCFFVCPLILSSILLFVFPYICPLGRTFAFPRARAFICQFVQPSVC